MTNQKDAISKTRYKVERA